MILARAAARSRHGSKGSVADPALRNGQTRREPATREGEGERDRAGAGRLGPYTSKRDFAATPEPRGQAGEANGAAFASRSMMRAGSITTCGSNSMAS